MVAPRPANDGNSPIEFGFSAFFFLLAGLGAIAQPRVVTAPRWLVVGFLLVIGTGLAITAVIRSRSPQADPLRTELKGHFSLVFLLILFSCFLLYISEIWTKRDLSELPAFEANLRQVAQAVNAYHNAQGCYPPAIVYGSDGQPLYSWRVLILPYLDLDAQITYDQFHKTEAWNSEHNLDLLNRRPSIYGAPKDFRLDIQSTHVEVIVGRGSIFESPPPITFSSITDIPAWTLLLVLGKEPVPWTSPTALIIGENGELPVFRWIEGGLIIDRARDDAFLAVCADGYTKLWPRSRITPEVIRGLVSRNGGDEPWRFLNR